MASPASSGRGFRLLLAPPILAFLYPPVPSHHIVQSKMKWFFLAVTQDPKARAEDRVFLEAEPCSRVPVVGPWRVFSHETSPTWDNLYLILKNTTIFLHSSLVLRVPDLSEHSLPHSLPPASPLFWRLSRTFLALLGTASHNVALWYWSIRHHLYQSVTRLGSPSLDVHLLLNFSDIRCFQIFPLRWWMSLAPDLITYSQASLLVAWLSMWIRTCLVVDAVSQSHPQLLHKLCRRYSMNTSTNATLPSKYSLCLLVRIIWLKCKWLISSSSSMLIVT